MSDKKPENPKSDLSPELLEELERLREENSHLKKALAEAVIDRSILREAVDRGIKKT